MTIFLKKVNTVIWDIRWCHKTVVEEQVVKATYEKYLYVRLILVHFFWPVPFKANGRQLSIFRNVVYFGLYGRHKFLCLWKKLKNFLFSRAKYIIFLRKFSFKSQMLFLSLFFLLFRRHFFKNFTHSKIDKNFFGNTDYWGAKLCIKVHFKKYYQKMSNSTRSLFSTGPCAPFFCWNDKFLFNILDKVLYSMFLKSFFLKVRCSRKVLFLTIHARSPLLLSL